MCIDICQCIYIPIYIYTYVYIWINVCICICVYIYIYIYAKHAKHAKCFWDLPRITGAAPAVIAGESLPGPREGRDAAQRRRPRRNCCRSLRQHRGWREASAICHLAWHGIGIAAYPPVSSKMAIEKGPLIGDFPIHLHLQGIFHCHVWWPEGNCNIYMVTGLFWELPSHASGPWP